MSTDIVQKVGRHRLTLLIVLAVSTLLAVALLAARIEYANRLNYLFLVWNLFLAWVPLGVAMVIDYRRSRGGASTPVFALLFAVWLVFFPNAPYILTDFVHLRLRPPVPLWYDALLLWAFAWNGLILGFTSLWLVQEELFHRIGTVGSRIAVAAVLAVSGFGVYLGRFGRWNSWDVLHRPDALFTDIADVVLNPGAHPHMLIFTVVFSGFLLAAYSAVVLLQNGVTRHRTQEF